MMAANIIHLLPGKVLPRVVTENGLIMGMDRFLGRMFWFTAKQRFRKGKGYVNRNSGSNFDGLQLHVVRADGIDVGLVGESKS